MHRTMSNPARLLAALGLALVVSGLGACRGGTSKSPPIHPVLDMDFQPKLLAQSKSDFPGWKDHRSMRLPVQGTVARGSLEDRPLEQNRDASGAFVTKNPVALTAETLARGRERFDIYCAICHGYSGRGGSGPTGHGMVGRRWPVAVPTFHVDPAKDATANRVAMLADGEIFEVITNGKNTMPAYGARIAPADRWAIIHYIRALQNLGKQ